MSITVRISADHKITDISTISTEVLEAINPNNSIVEFLKHTSFITLDYEVKDKTYKYEIQVSEGSLSEEINGIFIRFRKISPDIDWIIYEKIHNILNERISNCPKIKQYKLPVELNLDKREIFSK